MKPTASPSSCGGGDSRDIFSAEYTGLPGHHRIAQPPGGWCQDLWGGTYTGIPRQHRVLKPPGGGSSDIFGADNAEPRRQRNVNQLQSSTVFSNMMETVAGPKSKLNADSHCRLFGDAPPAPAPKSSMHSVGSRTAVADRASSEELPVEVATAATEDDKLSEAEIEASVTQSEEVVMSEVAARDSRRNPINHMGMTEADCSQTYNNRGRAPRKTDGNPVTGEGYAIANGVKEMAAVAPQAVAAPVVNGSATKVNVAPKVAAPAAPASAPTRGRVPPGGYSSGLW